MRAIHKTEESFDEDLPSSKFANSKIDFRKNEITCRHSILLGVLPNPNYDSLYTISDKGITLELPDVKLIRHQYEGVFTDLYKLQAHLFSSRESFFTYFIEGFNAAVISVGESTSLYDSEDGVIAVTLNKLFAHFKSLPRYSLAISSFSIRKQKGKELVETLLNCEAKSKREAMEMLSKVYKDKDFIGHVFVRFTIYNSESEAVSSLHLVSTMCHPHIEISSVNSPDHR
eukprot:TRINITY_DN12664_c0_g3_i1.p1 TRINITY_DN12664_c0_g3~~TRINITY_DN12664_c0_g3_i1.p1  ORF type:complete len:229 (+),score=31.17 TRINITY_DN12664_c0_g3_i1:167-853(+)